MELRRSRRGEQSSVSLSIPVAKFNDSVRQIEHDDDGKSRGCNQTAWGLRDEGSGALFL